MLLLPDGEHVLADERFFLVEIQNVAVSRDGWTAGEAEVIAEHRWWSPRDLARTSETVWPENLVAMLDAATSR